MAKTVRVVYVVALILLSLMFSLEFQTHQRWFTAEKLALYNGTDITLPICFVILGSVFDVTWSRYLYGVGGRVHHLAGRDHSRLIIKSLTGQDYVVGELMCAHLPLHYGQCDRAHFY